MVEIEVGSCVIGEVRFEMGWELMRRMIYVDIQREAVW